MKITGQPLRCLIVEDMEDDAHLLLRELRASGYDVTSERVDTPETMRAALERTPWDLVISDFSMPGFSGLDALKLLQASGRDLPFIMVTGAMGEDTAVATMQAGAHDYILKDKLARLRPAVARELTHAADRRARRLAEEATRRNESLLAAAGHLANLGGWRVNLAEGQVVWSEQVALIHEEPPGFSPTLAQGINYYAPEWREKITAVFTACARDGTPYDEEMEIITARGRRVWVRTTGEAVRDAEGRIHRVQGALQNISARKQAEAALRESEEKFKALADGSPLAIYMSTGIEQNATYINPTFLQLFGYSFEEVSSFAKWAPLAYPDETYRRQISEDWHQCIAQAIATGGEVVPKEAVVVCKDGSRKTILWGFKTAGKENWAFGLDLTARKQAEMALAAREEIFSNIVGQANDAIALVDAETGRLVEFNRAAHEGLGYTREEFAGFRISDIQAEKSQAQVAQDIRQIQTAGSLTFETRHRNRSGEIREVRISARPMKLRGRDYLTCVWSDITEAKQAEESLRQQAEEIRLRNESLSRFNAVAVGRELRMIELKREINELCDRVGEPPRHRIPAVEATTAKEPSP